MNSQLIGYLQRLMILGGLVVWELGSLPPAVAQLLYPPVSEQRAISVTGQGRASVPADRARLDILLTNQDPNARSPYDLSSEELAEMPKPPPITQASLRGVIEALTAAGVPESAIEVRLSPLDTQSRGYYSADNALTLTLQAPTQDQVNEIVKLVNDTLKAQTPQQTVFVSRIYLQYAINSCATVEQQAYAAAMADAQLRAEAIAAAMEVSLITPPSVAELPFLGRFFSPCNEDTDIIGALLWSPDASSYSPETPAEVEVYREVMVTYPVQ